MLETKKIVEIIRKQVPLVVGIYQFGSFATKYETPESDLDLAFLAKRKTTPIERWQLAEKIATMIGRDVHLVDLLEAPSTLIVQIIDSSNRIYCNDTYYCDFFETVALTEYLLLQERLAPLHNEIKKRGRVTDG